MNDRAEATLETPAIGGPDPQRWINRFFRFARQVPASASGDADTVPAAVEGASSPRSPGATFGTGLSAQAFPDPRWVATSADCAALLGWPVDWAERGDWRSLDVLTGQATWAGMQPWATVYSGHQFGVWAGQLGDGRALMLGEWQADAGTFEIQLKGAGRTPYSRMGDGRAVLRSSIREFLCSEAMHALGVPTTRALGVASSSLPVMRETLETGAIVARVAESFLRFGHFEHFAHTGQHAALARLVEFTIANWFSDLQDGAEVDGVRLDPLHAWLAEVVRRTARLMARWQSVGFAHGVMNTDNLSILGLTIDYGPFGFIDGFDPGHVCNHSDSEGRYAFGRQPDVAWWNLHALAHALKPLTPHPDISFAPILDGYAEAFTLAHTAEQRAKFGLDAVRADDESLIDELVALMAREHADYTLVFRRLALFDRGAGATPAALRDLFIDRAAIDAWGERYLRRLESEPRDDAQRRDAMRLVNPEYVLRNHLAQAAIEQAEAGDFAEVHRLHAVLRHPFEAQPGCERYAELPPDWARGIEVSCSS